MAIYLYVYSEIRNCSFIFFLNNLYKKIFTNNLRNNKKGDDKRKGKIGTIVIILDNKNNKILIS